MTFYTVGKIVNTQGLQGEVRVISTTDFPDGRYQKGSTLYIFMKNQEPIEVTVKSHRKHKNFDILSFENHPSINDVEKYKEGTLKVAEEDLQDLAENEFYYHEIIGLPVVTTDGEKLGTIKEILSPGANDVWVVDSETYGEILLPYIEDVVKKVDLETPEIIVELMEGLI